MYLYFTDNYTDNSGRLPKSYTKGTVIYKHCQAPYEEDFYLTWPVRRATPEEAETIATHICYPNGVQEYREEPFATMEDYSGELRCYKEER